MSSTPKPQKELREALEKESALFERYYLWLEESMPEIFFNEVSRDWISLIVHSLMGFKEQDYYTQIHLKNAAITLLMDSPEADVKILEGYPFYGIKSYSTYISTKPVPFPDIKGHLRIGTLHFTEAGARDESPLSSELKSELKSSLLKRNSYWTDMKCDQLIDQIDPSFLRKVSRETRPIIIEMFERAETRDNCQYEVHRNEQWEERRSPSMHVVLAWKNVPKHNFLYRLAKVVYQHGLVMTKVNAAYIHPYAVNSIFLLSFALHGAQGEAAWETTDITDFFQEVVTLKYFGSNDFIESTFIKPKLLRGNLGNFLRTMMNFIHQVLTNADPNLYTLETIEEGLCRHPELTVKLCEAFEAKCNPRQNDLSRFEKIRAEVNHLITHLDTGHELHDIRRKHILQQGMNFIVHLLKTNFYKNNKTAFAFRLDPLYLDHVPFDRKSLFPELPFGIFFFKGMHFLGFHIRFRDLSRGGLRTVYPKRRERMLAERNTIFSECYNLAYTQQKKNKDIPEGGAKGVIFLKPYDRLSFEAEIYAKEMRQANIPEDEIENRIQIFISEQDQEYLYQTQRSYVKTFLSLINCEPDGKLRSKDIIDYLGKPEYIYLGPDENMHDSMIEWIAQESKKEHYRPGGAFISGKPKIGINHKEYGVTSLGVNVFMEETLHFLGIDPKTQSFTVKMTGGPDGDVAGNEILNLHRFYPNTAKLIALTDVSGTIYDPAGLDLAACVDLFVKGKPIRYYPHEKLTQGGFLLDRDTTREPTPYVQQTLCYRNKTGKVESEWLSGNEMNSIYRHNVHEVKADIFIPCGGRPRTLRDTNCQEFLDEKGMPTAKAIIEGANLYLSPWARHFLEEKGVLIIKDSSANKCGVICSSFEIICGLTLKDAEFLEYKPVLVNEILARLKECALDEAKLLLSTHKATGQPLTELSEEVSKRINFFTDQLLDYLTPISLPKSPNDPLIQCFLHYCPKTLREKFEVRLLNEIPENHKKAIIASRIAARLVYRRGLSWLPTLVDNLPLILQDEELIY